MKGNCYIAPIPNPHREVLIEEEETMRGLERAVEWLRHFVDTKSFDYCVVWKLGDDPSRFIKWMDCCCNGGYGPAGVKEETYQIENHISSLCRDVNTRHLTRTKACEALACFPSSLPLYSGIHGEVVISNQPRWIGPGDDLKSTPSDESTGTRVLIPVIGGLIELYSGKHIPKDQKIIEFVVAQCNVVYLEQEAMIIPSSTNLSLHENPHIDSLLNEHLHNRPPSFASSSSLAKMQCLPPVTRFGHRSLEGSLAFTTPSNENSSLESSSTQLSPPLSSNQLIGTYLGSQSPKYSDNLPKQKMGLSSVCGKRVVEIDNVKIIKRSERENYQSKNLEMERTRRNRIRDGLFALRALVPKITKMDRASILGDAIEHIEELQKNVKKLQGELKELDDDCNKSAGLQGGKTDSPTAKFGEKNQMKVQVEVNQVGAGSFMLKLIYEHKRSGFVRLMETMNSLGLQVVDANVTTFDGKVLIILQVQANKEIQLKKLKDLLIKSTGYMSSP